MQFITEKLIAVAKDLEDFCEAIQKHGLESTISQAIRERRPDKFFQLLCDGAEAAFCDEKVSSNEIMDDNPPLENFP